MQEKFSIDDILNEVKALSGDRYVKQEKSPVNNTFDDKETVLADKNNTTFENDDFKKDEHKNPSSVSQMSAEEFLKMFDKEEPKPVDEDVKIVGGFKVQLDDVADEPEFSAPSDFEVKEEFKEEKEIQPEFTDKTIIFDKEKVKKAVNEGKKEQTDDSEFSGKLFRERHPEHLLSAEEIINNAINNNDTPSFRFSNRVKDLTKNNDGIKQEALDEKTENEDKDDLFSVFSQQYDRSQIEKNAPDELNNEFETKTEQVIEEKQYDDVVSNTSIEFDKVITEKELEEKQEPNRMARKTARRVEEKTFDYSEDVVNNSDEIEDYTGIDDEEDVRYDLDLSFKKVSRRLNLTAIIFILSFVLTVLPSLGVNLVSGLNPETNFTGFLVANAVVLVLTLLVNIGSFFNGLFSLITFKPDADSPLSIASSFVIAQSIMAFIPDFSATAGTLPFFTSCLSLGYFINLLGKKALSSRIKENFRIVATTSIKQSCFISDDRLGEMLENDSFIGTPYVACSKSVINLQNYLKNSYCEDPSDNFSRIFAPVSLVASLVTLLFLGFVSNDWMSAITFATAVALLSTPVCAVLSVSSPLKVTSRLFNRKDGLISGYEAVNQFSSVDCVALDAEDIFPAGSVELLSLRAIGDYSIEDVILKSAALTIGAGGPIADVFDKIIDGRRKMLPPIYNIVYEDGMGLSGNVEGKTVRIGNRKFIESYKIDGLVDDEIEIKAKKENFYVVYTAIDSQVCGMFAVRYKSVDPDIEDALCELVRNGVSLAVKTNDPNITPALVERVFEIPSEYVSVMEANSAEHYDNITRPSKNGNSVLAFGSNASMFMSLILACKKLSTKISASVLIQVILTIAVFGAGMLFSLIGITKYITPINILVFYVALMFFSVAVPKIIKRIK